MDPAVLYRALPPALRGAFLRELAKLGVDTSSIGSAPALPSKAPPRPFAPTSGHVDTVLSARPSLRSQLQGSARRDFERDLGWSLPDEIGPSRTPEGNLRIVSGCPGEYRAQQAAKGRR